MKRLGREAYTIGWYCPLAVPELQASRLLFDEEHEAIALPENPTFLYAYGEMNGHNVVMATAPATDMGIAPAAQVTSEMRTLHPALKFCLLVGVGGAVPRPESRDVRLGDVVVGVPDREGQHGGVIQYDFGKAKQDGVFQRIGALSRPHDTLLNAVSLIQSRMLSSTSFYQYLDLYLSPKDGGEGERYRRPMRDILYESTYSHGTSNSNAWLSGWALGFASPSPQPGTYQASCEEVGCDQAKAVSRASRTSERPVIHYGTIASGNKVVKDSKLRDQLAKADPNILCFEMEAAGIANSLPCLVVRGMCDYCDSHKNKTWQPFAAAAAAAFAKTILEQIPAQRVVRMANMKEPENVNKHWSVPRRASPQYTGYSHIIHRLEDRLLFSNDTEETSGGRLFVLSGMGGVGKSESVLQFAETYRNRFWGVFWVDCDSVALVRHHFKRVAHKCGWNIQEDAALIDEVREHLSNCVHDLLVILDNCDDASVDYSSYMPSGDRVRTIVTTRLPECRRYATRSRTNRQDHEHLDGLDPDSALELVLKEAGIGNPIPDSMQAAGRQMVKTLGYHPLAIVVGAASVRDGISSLQEYPAMFAAQEALLMRERSDQMPSRYGDVFTTFEVSARALRDSQDPAGRDALALLGVVAFWHREAIGEEIFNTAWAHEERVAECDTGDDNYDPLQLSHWHVARARALLPYGSLGARMSTFRRARSLLSRLSLATLDKDSGSFSVHPLVHSWARIRIAPHDIAQTWADAASTLALWVEGSPSYGPQPPRMSQHIEACVSAGFDNGGITFDWDAKETCRLLYVFAWHLYRADYTSALPTARRLEEEYEDAGWTPEHAPLWRMRYLLGVCLADAGVDQEALDILLNVVRAYEAQLPPDDGRLLSAQQALAGTYMDFGRLTEAVELLQRVDEFRGAESDPYQLTHQHDLAIAYRMDGQYRKAVALLEHVVEMEQVLSEDDPSRRKSKKELAVAYYCVGNLDKAVALLEDVVERGASLAGKDQVSLSSRHWLALMYQSAGRIEEAVALLEHVVEERAVLPEAETSRLASEHSLAKAYQAAGLTEKAESLRQHTRKVEDALVAADREGGERDLDVLHAVYKETGHHQEAEDLLQRMTLGKS